MKTVLTLVLLPFFCSAQVNSYTGTLLLKAGTTLTGKITVNLTGENKNLITIETSSNSEGKKKREKTSLSTNLKESLNLVIIKSLTIDNQDYYFFDLSNDKEVKNNLTGCLVKKILGNDTIGLFQWKDSTGKTTYYILPPLTRGVLTNIEHPDFSGTHFQIVSFAYGRCRTVSKKMYDKVEGYYYDNEKDPIDTKIKVWTNIIQSYINCQ